MYTRGAALGLVIAFLAVSGWTVRSQPARTVWDGVYTDKQAQRGQEAFGEICSRCHTVEDFSGDAFLSSWEASSALDLFSLMLKTMPMDNPGSLDPQEYVDIVAFFFRTNAFPAGATELDTQAERLQLIRIQRKK